jgi:hypothetical protein
MGSSEGTHDDTGDGHLVPASLAAFYKWSIAKPELCKAILNSSGEIGIRLQISKSRAAKACACLLIDSASFGYLFLWMGEKNQTSQGVESDSPPSNQTHCNI